MAGFEDSAGINVNNYYGARDSVGAEGVTNTSGIFNEFTYDTDNTGIGFGFPTPAGSQDSYYVCDVFAADGGTVTSLDIGGVAVEAAVIGDVTTWVEIVEANTGVLSGFAGTAVGRVVVRYMVPPKA